MYIIGIGGGVRSYAIGIIISSVISGFMLFILSPWLIDQGREIANRIEKELQSTRRGYCFRSIGLIVGLIISYLITNLITNIMPFQLLGYYICFWFIYS